MCLTILPPALFRLCRRSDVAPPLAKPARDPRPRLAWRDPGPLKETPLVVKHVKHGSSWTWTWNTWIVYDCIIYDCSQFLKPHVAPFMVPTTPKFAVPPHHFLGCIPRGTWTGMTGSPGSILWCKLRKLCRKTEKNSDLMSSWVAEWIPCCSHRCRSAALFGSPWRSARCSCGWNQRPDDTMAKQHWLLWSHHVHGGKQNPQNLLEELKNEHFEFRNIFAPAPPSGSDRENHSKDSPRLTHRSSQAS